MLFTMFSGHLAVRDGHFSRVDAHPVLQRTVPTFLSLGTLWGRKIRPMGHPGLPKDLQRGPKWCPRGPKMTPKRHLEASKGAKGLPRGLRGTPPEQKDVKKTPKFTRGQPSAMKFVVTDSLQEASENLFSQRIF